MSYWVLGNGKKQLVKGIGNLQFFNGQSAMAMGNLQWAIKQWAIGNG
jgi:hypothetical protein